MIDTFTKLNLGAMLRLSAIPEDIDPLDRQVAILAVLSGCSQEDILALPLEEYSRRVIASKFLDQDLPARVLERSYKVGAWELVPVRDMRKVTTAQFVDFKTFADQAGGDGRRLSAMTVELLSCMMVPRGHQYCDDYDPMEVQAAIRDHLRADDAVTLSAFFLAQWMRLSRRILRYSRREARRMGARETLGKIKDLGRIRKRLTNMPQSGDGLV